MAPLVFGDGSSHLLSMKNYSVESTDYPSTLSLYQCFSGRDLVFLPHYEEVNGWYLGAYDGSLLVGFVAGNVWTEAITATIAVLPEYRERVLESS